MNKEQAAQIYCDSVVSKYPEDCKEDFMEGWDAGQKQLLDEAAKDFEDWHEREFSLEESSEFNSFKNLDDKLFWITVKSWQAAKLSRAAELAAKDEEIKRLKEVILEISEGVTIIQHIVSHGLSHYEDCSIFNQVDEDEEETPCDCGAGDKELFGLAFLDKISKHAALIEAIKGVDE